MCAGQTQTKTLMSCEALAVISVKASCFCAGVDTGAH